MLEVSARFRRYSFNNQLLIWAQATHAARPSPGSPPSAPGASSATGCGLGEKGLRIFGPVTRRAAGPTRSPPGSPPAGTRSTTTDGPGCSCAASPWSTCSPWIAQQGDGPDGLWAALVALTEAHGFTLDLRPARSEDGGAHGWSNYAPRRVWANSARDEAERVRILAHETAAHIRCDQNTTATSPAGAAGDRGRQRRLRGARRARHGRQLLHRGVRGRLEPRVIPICCGPPRKPCIGWPPRSSPTSTIATNRARPPPDHGLLIRFRSARPATH